MGGEVIGLRVKGFGKGLPHVDLAHVNLTGRQDRPEQHRVSFGRGQNSLRLDAPLELNSAGFSEGHLLMSDRMFVSAMVARPALCESEGYAGLAGVEPVT